MTQAFCILRVLEYHSLINEWNSVLFSEISMVYGVTLRKNTYPFENDCLILKHPCRDYWGNIIFFLSLNEHI